MSNVLFVQCLPVKCAWEQGMFTLSVCLCCIAWETSRNLKGLNRSKSKLKFWKFKINRSHFCQGLRETAAAKFVLTKHSVPFHAGLAIYSAVHFLNVHKYKHKYKYKDKYKDKCKYKHPNISLRG